MRGGALPGLKSSFQKGLATSGSPSTTSRLDLASAEGNSLWRWAKQRLTSIRERLNQKIQGHDVVLHAGRGNSVAPALTHGLLHRRRDGLRLRPGSFF